MQYHIQRFEIVEQWLTDQESNREACLAMSNWVKAAVTGPRELSNGTLQREGQRRRKLHYAMIPGAEAIITYTVADQPVRVMAIISIIPAPE